VQSSLVEWVYYCHAYGCETSVAPGRLMCDRHWEMLTRLLRKRIGTTYRIGMTLGTHPSPSYLAAAHRAVIYIADQEHMPIPLAYRKYRPQAS
jgi:hypothetical protein